MRTVALWLLLVQCSSLLNCDDDYGPVDDAHFNALESSNADYSRFNVSGSVDGSFSAVVSSVTLIAVPVPQSSLLIVAGLIVIVAVRAFSTQHLRSKFEPTPIAPQSLRSRG